MKFRNALASSLAAVVVLSLSLAGVAAAQRTVEGEIKDVVELTRKQVETERQAIVTENLNLSDKESEVFWPMYRDYMADRSKIGDKRVALIKSYASSYKTMDDETAKKLLDQAFSVDEERMKLKRSWAKKMSKAVSPITTARFFQIEHQLDLIVDAGIADQVPLMVKGKPAVAEPVSGTP